jgi:CSLREA domain-containing protein
MQKNPRPTFPAPSRSIIIGLILALAVSAKAATVTVTTTADSGGSCPGSNCTLRQAIATAPVDATIDFAVTGQIKLTNGELGISRNLNIAAPTTTESYFPPVSIDAENRSRIFSVTGGTVRISGLGMYNGMVRGTDVPAGSYGSGGKAEGGAVYVGSSGRLTLSECVIYANHVVGGRGGKSNGTGILGGSGNGGGVANRGSLTLQNCSLANNTATGGDAGDYSGGPGNGGGVFNGGSGNLTMTGCTVVDNEAHGGLSGTAPYSGEAYGGGFANGDKRDDSDLGFFTLTNCTFRANMADGADAGGGSTSGGQAFGGGIFAYRGPLNNGFAVNLGSITNCTLAENAVWGGKSTNGAGRSFVGGPGLDAQRGNVQLSNTLITRNTAQTGGTSTPRDVYGGSIVSVGYNFVSVIDGSQGSTWQSTDNTGTASTPLDAKLGDFHSFGMLEVYRLSFSSAAIDAGNSSLATDQRGEARPADQPSIENAAGGNGSDIGAYEMRTAPLTFVVTNTNDSGAGSLRQAIADANDEGQFDFIRFNIPTSDPGYDASTQVYSINLTSGELAITSLMSIDGGNARIAIGRAAGASPFRLFNISANGVTLANLFLRNGASMGAPSQPGLGGAVFNSGGLTLLNCAFSGNTATGGAGVPQLFQGLPGGEGLGGAVCNDGTLVMTNCTFSGNTAQGGAGGFGFSANGISGRGGNGGNGRGGALFSNQGPVTITNCTFARNTALGSAPGGGDTAGAPGSGIGGAARFDSGQTTLYNSFFSGNTAAFDPAYSGTAGGDGDFIVGTTNLDDTLRYNGGPTPTVALLAGSPLINNGVDAYAPSADQRGYSRVGVSDVGAFEFGGSLPMPTPTATPVTTLANISTRLRVETGDNVLIGGFIVTGSQPKKVIIRAIGTSLPFADKLANPTLELHGPNGLIEANDNWIDSPNKQAIIDSTIPPGSDLESAIVATLPANNAAYTAIVRGANGSTGIGVVEAYDLDTAANSRLANISTRGLVQTGDNVLIAGTIVVGPSSQRVLIRGIGPSLPVAGKMADPFLELRDSNGAVMQSNDNWVDSPNKQAIIDTTVPPTNDLESAIIATLPGNNASYTAVLRGVNDTTGIAVVEVYALQ